jgi:hypothetical protein
MRAISHSQESNKANIPVNVLSNRDAKIGFVVRDFGRRALGSGGSDTVSNADGGFRRGLLLVHSTSL